MVDEVLIGIGKAGILKVAMVIKEHIHFTT
jgi:hypothetical protein